MTQNPPRRHHFIPEFYSRQWAGADGLMERFTKPRDIVVDRRVPPKRVGWQRDLYTIPLSGKDEAQGLEEGFFRVLDDLAAKALAKLLQPQIPQLTDIESSAWATFMRSLMHRSPSDLTATKRAAERIWGRVGPDVHKRYLELRRPADPPTYDEFLAARNPLETERTTLEFLPKLLTGQKIGDFMTKLDWLTFDVPPGEFELLLSDNPLLRTGGLTLPGAHMAMPLSPRRLLVAVPERAVALHIDKQPVGRLVKALNRWTVESARHFVVARDLSQQLFIQRHFGVAPQPPIMRV